MKDPLQMILQQTGITNSYFSATSRYFGLDVKILTSDDGSKKVYVKRRFIAQPENFQVVDVLTVNQDERLDNITHHYLGDPEQFWRICDSNAAMHPNELTDEIGKKINITLPGEISSDTNQ